MNTVNHININVILEFVYVNLYQMIVLNTFGQNIIYIFSRPSKIE